jgi:hypothetical protein
MRNVVGECAGHSRKHVLKALIRHEVSVSERRFAETGEKIIALPIEPEIGRSWSRRERRGQRR